MKQKYYLLLLTILISCIGFANNGKDSLLVKTPASEPMLVTSTSIQSRSFKELNTKIEDSYFKQINKESEFTNEYILKNFVVSSIVNDHLKEAITTFKMLDENGNYIESLQPSDLVELPVGIKKTVNNIQYILGISAAKFTPQYTELTAFVRIILPQQDAAGNQKQLFFGANNVRLSHKGGLIGESNLVLLGDVPFRINGGNGLVVLHGGMEMKTGEVTNKTYVTINCDGFKELAIDAEVQFPRSMLTPVDNNYKEIIDENIKVAGKFNVIVSDWNDIMAEISLPKFQLTSFKNTIFELNTAVFDFSDIRNSSDVVWPENYKEQYLVAGNEELWRGVYVKSLTVVLPEQFKKRGTTERVKFQAANLLVDGMGVSGKFSADNILPLHEGEASKWQFSVNHIEATFVANNLTAGGFNGGIVLPLSKKASAQNTSTTIDGQSQNNKNSSLALAYTAIINPVNNEYILKANPAESIKFDLWKATAIITKNSYVELKVKDNSFKPKAVLHGSMGVYTDSSDSDETQAANMTSTVKNEKPNDKKTVQFEGIVFQNLQLQTESPVLSVDYFGYKGEVKMANFPVTISDIELKTTNTTASLEFNLAINLMKDQFSGEARLGIVGAFGEDEGLQKWKFKKIDISEISLQADIGGAEFEGTIKIRNDDPIYGDGFAGNITAKFAGLGANKVTVSANAIFGKLDYRYWYVDAMVDNLNIKAGAFSLKGFAGGAFYRMKKVGFSSSFTPSGTNYQPDKNSGLGIKAMIHFANAAKEDVLWGGAGFEIAFNSSGGLNRVSIYGEAHIMQSFGFDNPAASLVNDMKAMAQNELGFSDKVLNKLKETNLVEVSKQIYPDRVSGQAGLNAYAAIEYDFNLKTLHGSFDLYVDAAGGLIKGRASGNRAGWAVFHVAPDTWYFHMGTPTDRLGLKMGLGSFNVEAGGYFMVGDDIPGSPPPPDIVADILGLDADVLDYMRDENTLDSGKGLAFGSDFSLDTGDMTFLIFYARFQAGFGFDIMVKDYGEAECKGSGQIGIDGWYANDQAYAYLQGEVGIKIKLLFVRKKIPILKAGAAALFQAKLPNPTWLRGYVGGHYSVLGGLIKGRFRFKIELGEECELINGTPLGGLKVIADINPGEGTTDIDVFAVPQAGFNLAINESFKLEDDNGKAVNYRIKLDEFSISEGGKKLIADVEISSDNSLATVLTSEILPPHKELSVLVRVVFEEYKDGKWQLVMVDGKKAEEVETRTFTTGDAPDYIPLTNIDYCYPVVDQKYVYKDEHKNAYIGLIRGQGYLFELKPGYSQQSVFESGNSVLTSTLSYSSGQKKLTIPLPQLVNNRSYSMSIVTQPPGTSIMDNISESYNSVDLGQDTETDVRANILGETAINGDAIELLAFNFSTSNYNRFADKIKAKKLSEGLVEIIYGDVHALQASINNSEPFEAVELVGNKYTDNIPLIETEAILTDSYYKNDIQPLIYNNYPMENIFTVNRDVSVLGMPPVKAVEPLSWYQTYLKDYEGNSLLNTRLPFGYYLALYYKQDLIDIRYKVVNRYVNYPDSYPDKIQQYNYLINAMFPYIKKGNYETKLTYKIPGGITGSSEKFIFNKPY